MNDFEKINWIQKRNIELNLYKIKYILNDDYIEKLEIIKLF